MKHYLRCKNCGGKIEHNLLNPSSILKCSHCEKEYVVMKHIGAMTFELIFLFAMALLVRALLSFANTTFNIILELVIVIMMLLVLNVLYDLLFIKVFKWKCYYRLVERENPSQHKKRKKIIEHNRE